MEMIGLIITDIDGTLLDDNGDLPPGNAEALAAAVARGARLALATIRKRDSTEAIARQLGLPCALVCQGGAPVSHTEAPTEAALEFPSCSWEIAWESALALGDSGSAIGMIRMAGGGVAVANAHRPVKQAADWVAPSAGDAGVAAAVRRFVL